jgi:hypothetical protein
MMERDRDDGALLGDVESLASVKHLVVGSDERAKSSPGVKTEQSGASVCNFLFTHRLHVGLVVDLSAPGVAVELRSFGPNAMNPCLHWLGRRSGQGIRQLCQWGS